MLSRPNPALLPGVRGVAVAACPPPPRRTRPWRLCSGCLLACHLACADANIEDGSQDGCERRGLATAMQAVCSLLGKQRQGLMRTSGAR